MKNEYSVLEENGRAQRAKNEIQLPHGSLKHESGYDERVWPRL